MSGSSDGARCLAQEHDVLVRIGVRLAVGQHRLAERVEGDSEPPAPHAADGRYDLPDRRPGNEAARHSQHVPSRCARDDLADGASLREVDAEPQRSGEIGARAAEILDQVPRYVAGRQSGQNIDESEKLRLQVRMVHAEIEETLVPPRRVGHPRVVRPRVLEESAGERLRGLFDMG